MEPVRHDRIKELTHEHIDIVPYDVSWSRLYEQEEAFLERTLPPRLVKRIAHIGSTAVPGLSAKPVIDIQVEVKSLEDVRTGVVPVLQALGYEYIWRPTIGEQAPFYAWFIKRNAAGHRTHHIHMVEPDQASDDRILFRDFLRSHPGDVQRYETLKRALCAVYPNDRVAYTKGKTDFIASVLKQARTQRS